ncbi:ATPase AAA-type core domain-containing protein OS=Streptomyces microflavus OX=1919 GN=Smic_38040 PE=4 SV=1 [Streptomyces microflavus]
MTDRLAVMTDGLATVTDVVAGLEIGDATVRTSILERIAQVLGGANRARATLDARRRELLSKEGRGSPPSSRCSGRRSRGRWPPPNRRRPVTDQLARRMLQLENLESRFAEFDDFLAELAGRRERGVRGFLGP